MSGYMDSAYTTFGNLMTTIRQEASQLSASAESHLQSIERNPTGLKILAIAPMVIAAVGSYFAPVALTVTCVLATLILNKVSPSPRTARLAQCVLMGVGASIGITKIVYPFTRIIAYAAASAGLIYVGLTGEFLSTKKSVA